MTIFEKFLKIDKCSQYFKKVWQSLFFTENIFSPQNGLVKVRKFFGSYEVISGGCFQSGWYVTALWRKIFKSISSEHTVKTVLMIGLGGGGGIEEVRKKFPSAGVVAIEHDPIMVDIAKRIVFDRIKYSPELIIQDARVAIEAFVSQQRKFDVVILDIFNGNEPSPLMYSSDFVSLLSQVLENGGYLLVNFYKNEKTIAPIFGEYFSCWECLRYQFNRMRVYRQFGEGKVGDPAPKGFTNRAQSEIYLSSALIRPWPSQLVGKEGCRGVRYFWGLFAVELYGSDQEPVITSWKGLRLIVWHPVSQVNRKKSWIRNPLSKSGWQMGFARNSPCYWEAWSNHAKRHRTKWKKDSRHVLYDATVDEFEKAYTVSNKLDFLMRTGFIRVVRFHADKHPENLELYLVKNRESGKDVAGLAVINYLDVSQSHHTISFIDKEAQKSSVGYGLIDNWFLQSQNKGIDWLDFGLVWKKGDPRSWKGYSKFKRQFGLYLIDYPRSYFKLTIG